MKSPQNGTSYFEKPAMRAHYFYSNSAFLLGALIFAGFLAIRYEDQLPAFCVVALGVVACGLISFWFAMFRVHSEIHGLIATGNFESPEVGSPADRAFGTVAAVIFHGLLSTAGLVGLCLLALAKILRNH